MGGLVVLKVRLNVLVKQFEIEKVPGPTRSSRAAVAELPDVRLTAEAFPKVRHGALVPVGKTPAAVRSSPASPNSLVPRVTPPFLVVQLIGAPPGGAMQSSADAGKGLAPVSTAASLKLESNGVRSCTHPTGE